MNAAREAETERKLEEERVARIQARTLREAQAAQAKLDRERLAQRKEQASHGA